MKKKKRCARREHKFEIDLDSYDPWGWRTVHCAKCGAYYGEVSPEGDTRDVRF